MNFEYMRPRQDRSDIKVITVPRDLRMFAVGKLSGSSATATTIKAGTLAELIIAGKIGAQHVLLAIHNGTIKAARFKILFWKEIRGTNVDRLPQAALTAIGLLMPILI